MSELARLFDLDVQAYLSGPLLLAALAGLGLVVGVLTGVFGVGGAFLLTPLMKLAFGIPYDVAIGSGLSYTVGSCASGAARHMRLRNFEPRTVAVLGATTVVGALAGAALNAFTKGRLGERNYTLTMHALFIVMLLATAWLIGRKGRLQRSRKSPLRRLPLPPRIDLPRADLPGVSLPGLCVLGLFVGVLKGMMGIGGGVVLMPLLILVVGLTAHQAVGTSLGVVVFSSIAGALGYGWGGKVNLCIVMALLVCSVFGIQVGAWICDKLHAERLQRYFAILVLVVVAAVAADFAWKLLS
jgi:hypothetical protein